MPEMRKKFKAFCVLLFLLNAFGAPFPSAVDGTNSTVVRSTTIATTTPETTKLSTTLTSATTTTTTTTPTTTTTTTKTTIPTTTTTTTTTTAKPTTPAATTSTRTTTTTPKAQTWMAKSSVSASTDSTTTHSSPCLEKSLDGNEQINTKCSYRISRLIENEYLMIKNILNNLVDRHWNVTQDFLNVYLESSQRICDQYFDYVGISQVIAKDFRHPNYLFRRLENSTINQTIKMQYEAEWFYRYKMINYALQPSRNLQLCNNLGLKIYFLMHDYAQEQYKIFKCSSKLNQEEPVTSLIDYYIAQTFIKSCDGNLELLANSIYRLIKFDCERASRFKLAYYNSKYLNMFRTCDPEMTVNDLLNTGRFKNCTNLGHLSGLANRKYCSWFEAVCKYPYTCLKSMSWIDN